MAADARRRGIQRRCPQGAGLSSNEEGVRVFNCNVRRALPAETEMLFSHLLHNDLSVLDLLTADYTFLNEPLAKFYGIDGVDGDKMRKATFFEERPSRRYPDARQHSAGRLPTPPSTSPVKRGLFVLENLLGNSRSPRRPPNVPPLDSSATGSRRKLTLRQLMEVHRRDVLCVVPCSHGSDRAGAGIV